MKRIALAAMLLVSAHGNAELLGASRATKLKSIKQAVPFHLQKNLNFSDVAPLR